MNRSNQPIPQFRPPLVAQSNIRPISPPAGGNYVVPPIILRLTDLGSVAESSDAGAGPSGSRPAIGPPLTEGQEEADVSNASPYTSARTAQAVADDVYEPPTQ